MKANFFKGGEKISVVFNTHCFSRVRPPRDEVRNLFNLPAWSVIDDMEDNVDSVSDAGGG